MQESEYMKEKEENKESENPSILVLGNEGRGVSYSVTVYILSYYLLL